MTFTDCTRLALGALVLRMVAAVALAHFVQPCLAACKISLQADDERVLLHFGQGFGQVDVHADTPLPRQPGDFLQAVGAAPPRDERCGLHAQRLRAARSRRPRERGDADRDHRAEHDGRPSLLAAEELGDLEDEVIESIRTFDVDTQRTIYKVNDVRLLPAREFPTDEEARSRFRQNFREKFEGDPSRSRVYKDVSKSVAPGMRAEAALSSGRPPWSTGGRSSANSVAKRCVALMISWFMMATAARTASFTFGSSEGFVTVP